MYCSSCGVKLQDYHEECVLCGTKLTNKNIKENRDYPVYKTNAENTNKKVIQLFMSRVMTVLLLLSSMLCIVIDLNVSNRLTWSLIVTATLFVVLIVWKPLLARGINFYKTYSFIGIISAVLVGSIDFVLNYNITWSIYPMVGLFISWIILTGLFKKEDIKNRIPISAYYGVGFSLAFLVTYLAVNNPTVMMGIILPAFVALIVATLIMYFMVEIMVHDTIGVTIVLLGFVSIFALLTDALVADYLGFSWRPTWSYYVLISVLPLIGLGIILRKGNELRCYLAKKMHR